MRPSADVVVASKTPSAFSYTSPQAWSWTARAIVVLLVALPVLTVVAYRAWWPETCLGSGPWSRTGPTVVKLSCSSPEARWVVTYVGVVEAGDPRCPPPNADQFGIALGKYYYCTEPLPR